MKALVFGRISVAKAGWLIVAFVVIWPLFVLLPFGRKEVSSPVHATRTAAGTKLSAVGLKPNLDWEGMPELFAVSAAQAWWDEEKTQFAYWHPGANAYAYFFEATRYGERYRFRAITKREALTGKEFLDEGSGVYQPTNVPPTSAQVAAFTLAEPSPTHPFVFFRMPSPVVADAAPMRSSPSRLLTKDPTTPKAVDVQISDDRKGN
jgi:hypothetical protein